MQFKDLVAKLDELIVSGPNAVMPKIPANANVQKNPLGTGAGGLNVAQKALQASQDAQAAQTPPAEKPIPGQQPNLGPKTVVPQTSPQQVIGAPPAPAQQQQANGGMAAAILQAVNQMKTQQSAIAPTSSQSIAQQKQQAATPANALQSTAKPGEPLEEQNKVPGLSDKEIKDWVFSLNKDPSYITHPEWKYIDKDSKIKILKTIKTEHPTVSNYIDVQRKIAKEKSSDVPDNDYIAQLEKQKTGAWEAHFANKKQAPKSTEPVNKDTTTAPVPTQAQVQELGKAYNLATDPAQKEQALKAYNAAAAALASAKKNEPVVRSPISKDTAGTDTNKTPAAPAGDTQTFSQAFAAARKEAKGPDGRFNWTDPKTGKTVTYTTAYKDEVKKDVAPVEPAKADDSQDSEFRQQNLDRIKKMAGVVEPTKPLEPATVVNQPVTPVVVPGAEKQAEPAKVVEPAKPVATEPKKDGYQFFKKDAQGKTYMDPFNIGPSKSAMDKQQPGDGPPVRDATPKPVEKEPVKEMSLQSVVDELLTENSPTKEDTTSTASKWATKSAKLAPWVGNVAKGANAALSASDIADYAKKGDKVGAGIASAALAADAIGTVFPPASWASFALDAANAGRDVYLHQTGQDYKDPDAKQMQAKEELSNIVNLAKYKVDKK